MFFTLFAPILFSSIFSRFLGRVRVRVSLFWNVLFHLYCWILCQYLLGLNLLIGFKWDCFSVVLFFYAFKHLAFIGIFVSLRNFLNFFLLSHSTIFNSCLIPQFLQFFFVGWLTHHISKLFLTLVHLSCCMLCKENHFLSTYFHFLAMSRLSHVPFSYFLSWTMHILVFLSLFVSLLFDCCSPVCP